MNVVPFYFGLGIVLASIFVFFKPLHVEIDAPERLAQIELERFEVFEVTTKGVKTMLIGRRARRFQKSYVVDDINMTDRSHGHRDNLCARLGIYKEGFVTLENDVRLRRDDGSLFETQKATYDQNSSIVRAHGAFVFYRGPDTVRGSDLYYDLESGRLRALHVEGIYTIKEKM